MPSKVEAHEQSRDDNFGIMRKAISFPALKSIETPTKCVKNPSPKILSSSDINEIIKKISPKTIESMWNGTDTPSKSVKPRLLPNKLNLTIFELMLDRVPDITQLKTIANYWYAASQSVLFLPTVSSLMLKEDGKLSEKKIAKYVEMMRFIIETTEQIGNSKVFMGTIPLMAPKFSYPIIKLYLEKGFTAFAIDVGTKDFMNHESEFRYILTEINGQVPLNNAFIYACNLGIPQFDMLRARADDFLSLFAYVDAFGSTFKTRGGGNMPVGKPRVKKFQRSELCYEHIYDSRDRLNDFNQCEQVTEANLVRNLVGKEKMQKYLDSKKAVDASAIKHLGSIAEKIKIV